MASSVMNIAKTYPASFDEEFSHYPRIIRQIAFTRGIITKDELERFMNSSYKDDIHDPFLFPDMKKVVKRIMETKESGEKVTIYGDYDADGIDGAAILARTFKILGITFNTYIPHRLIEGYGINKDSVKKLAEDGTKLIISVDCGISNSEEVAFASENNIDVIITDHHQMLKEKPDAFAIIHPILDKEFYPDSNLTGGGVAFKLAQALIKTNEKIFPEGYEKWLLDLAAISTIADYGKLVGENRAIVKYGLIVFNKTKNLGLIAMKDIAGLKHQYDCIDIAFKVIPLINAAGRMNHGVAAYEALVEEDKEKALEYANNLLTENKKRRELSDAMYKEALTQAREQEKEKLIVVKNKKWPITLVGIVATRIMNEFGKPTFAIGHKKELWAGSGRSLPSYDISLALQEHKDMFEDYGGHAVAGGFTFKESVSIDEGVKTFQKHAKKLLKGVELVPQVDIEAEISLDEINEDLIDWLSKLKPFGAGNPQPRFLIKDMKLSEVYPLGKNGNHLKLMVPKKGGGHMKCVFFNGTKKYAEKLIAGATCDAIVELDYNEWMGMSEIQIKIIDVHI